MFKFYTLLTTSEALWFIILDSVCLSYDNFQKPWRLKFTFAHPVYLHRVWVKFVYEVRGVKVKVTGAKKVRVQDWISQWFLWQTYKLCIKTIKDAIYLLWDDWTAFA